MANNKEVNSKEPQKKKSSASTKSTTTAAKKTPAANKTSAANKTTAANKTSVASTKGTSSVANKTTSAAKKTSSASTKGTTSSKKVSSVSTKRQAARVVGAASNIKKIIAIIIAAVLVVSAIVVAICLIPKKKDDDTKKPMSTIPGVTPGNTEPAPNPIPVTLRILSIGDEFVEDGQRYLYDIALEAGVQTLEVASAVFEGASIEDHYGNIESDASVYTYSLKSNGTVETEENQDLETIIKSRDWDYITFQQSFDDSSDSVTYEYAQDLIEKVVPLCKNAQICWNMSWSANNSNYVSIYEDIVEAVQEKIIGESSVNIVIPTGTAIQNIRRTYLKDQINRTEKHLSYEIGSYVASMTYAKAIGLPVENIEYKPENEVIGDQRVMVSLQERHVTNEVVRNTFNRKYAESFTSFTTENTKVGYIQIDSGIMGLGYWNSEDIVAGVENKHIIPSTPEDPDKPVWGDNYAYTRRFDKSELPVGTIIEIKAGYVYRPDAWVDNERNEHNTRPGEVFILTKTIDEAWWAHYNKRAFNIRKSGKQDMTYEDLEDLNASFKIYVPIGNFDVDPEENTNPLSLKVLSIGNSFSDDAQEVLYHIFDDLGVTDITIANLFEDSASLSFHATNATNQAKIYDYKIMDSDGLIDSTNSKSDVSIQQALAFEDWDYVTIQQNFDNSDDASTYNNDINTVVDVVNNICPEAKVLWHMTWAGKNDLAVNNAKYTGIVSAVQSKIATNNKIDGIIPTGTTIQNLRNTYIKDTPDKINRDGKHLAHGVGTYAAGVTFAKAFGLDISKLKWYPNDTYIFNGSMTATVTAQEQQVVLEAVRNAYNKPYSVSNTNFDVEPAKEGYIQIDLGIMGIGYYDSTKENGEHLMPTTQNNDDAESKCYVYTKKFTKAELVNNAIIEITWVDDTSTDDPDDLKLGYKYRPEGWIGEAINTNLTRPDEESKKIAIVVIDDAWWGDFTQRAFNIAFVTKNVEITDANIADVYTGVKIYVPVNAA